MTCSAPAEVSETAEQKRLLRRQELSLSQHRRHSLQNKARIPVVHIRKEITKQLLLHIPRQTLEAEHNQHPSLNKK